MPVGGAKKRVFLRTLRQRVTEFLEETEGADMERVVDHFGSPETIGLSFLEEMSYSEISQKFRFRNRVIAIALAVAILCLAGVGLAIHEMIEYNKSQHDGPFVISEAVVTSEAIDQTLEGDIS